MPAGRPNRKRIKGAIEKVRNNQRRNQIRKNPRCSVCLIRGHSKKGHKKYLRERIAEFRESIHGLKTTNEQGLENAVEIASLEEDLKATKANLREYQTRIGNSDLEDSSSEDDISSEDSSEAM